VIVIAQQTILPPKKEESNWQ